jgi:hypothetical protein
MANEKRLIDAKELMENGWHLVKTGESNVFLASMSLADVPTVDAVEVVHGRWLYDSGSGKYFCSACDEYALSFKKDTLYGGDLYEVCLTDYCPNCGAKMDGGNQDG